MSDYHSGRFAVVRYPRYYVVIDQQNINHKIVYESHNRDSVHARCSKLNKAHREGRLSSDYKILPKVAS